MKDKKQGILLILLVLLVSVIIMILPTFLTKGVSRIVSNKEVNLPLILNDTKDIELVFFGYAGCTNICTPRLLMIDKLYRLLNKETKERVGVAFLDISLSYDRELPQRFATFFNPNFKGIYLNKDILRLYTKIFDVYFAPSLMDKTSFDHTGHLYLLKRTNENKVIRYIYHAYPYDFKQITSDIAELVNE